MQGKIRTEDKPKKKLPNWVNQKAGSVVVPKGNKPIGSKSPLMKNTGGNVSKPKKAKKTIAPKVKAANTESSKKLLRGILTGNQFKSK